MNALASRLYEGRIFHARHKPFRHSFFQRVFALLIDLDELPQLHRRSWIFGWNTRFRPLSFRDRDHGPRDGRPLRPWAEALAAKAGFDASGPMRLLCFPRLWGYVFDPLTIWFLHDRDGRPSGLIHEVRNTFGESHSYVCAGGPVDGVYIQDAAKRFHVSPFFDRLGGYRFRVAAPGDDLRVAIRLDGAEGPRLTATHIGEARVLDDRRLASAILRRPAMTWAVIGGIHWQALLLWRKGARFHRRPPAPKVGASVAEAS
ncbi:MAG: DUF1365 domain-containing protein [Pseudomonadota bacterium]